MLYICREIYQKSLKNIADRCYDMRLQDFRNAKDCNCDPRELTNSLPSSNSEEFLAILSQSTCYIMGKMLFFN